ncbi:MAG: flagellar biosynthetic protein FliR [Bdellovibrionaceae bacterium]|nr:flagellar biosynthetic protein FliR [Pseudobdellovibrionaceae bacterium]
MSQYFNFNYSEILAAFLVLMRISAFIVSWPLFGENNVPRPIKIFFALLLTIMLFPVVPRENIAFSMGTYEIFFRVFKEVLIGLSLGFLSRMFFYIMSIAGQIISVSMGLSGAQLMNPATGARSTPMSQLQVMLASLFFLAIHGHHMLLIALTESFKIIKISELYISFEAFGTFGVLVQRITLIGVQLSAPVLISILIMNVVMAIIGRAVPQINVLITSLPVNILVGLMVVLISIPMIVGKMPVILDETTVNMMKLLKSY